MNEEYLYFIWENRFFKTPQLYTPDHREIQIIHPGYRNHDSGPDYHFARLLIGGQEWSGQVEMHVKSSDWYRHGHQNDPAYQVVILHVVWENDQEVCLKCPGDLPVLVLSEFARAEYLESYRNFQRSPRIFPCQSEIHELPELLKRQWMDRLRVDRLEMLSDRVIKTLKFTGNDWQETLYLYLIRSFGMKVNTEAFEMLGKRLSYRFVARYRQREHALEAVLFGQAGMLRAEFKEAYPVLLQKEYQFWRMMYAMEPMSIGVFRFHRMRPSAFPQLRIAQLASVLRSVYPISDLLLSENSLNELQQMLSADPHEYWIYHYRFGQQVKRKAARMGKASIDRIILHAIVPLMFTRGKMYAKESLINRALDLLEELGAEENKIIRQWKKMGIQPFNAGDSQALIHSFKTKCSGKKCLSCLLGQHILARTETHDTQNI